MSIPRDSFTGASWRALTGFLRRVTRNIRERGVVGLWRRAWFLTRTMAAERFYGIRTEGFIARQALSDNADSVDYEASGYDTLKRAFRHLDIGPHDVFLDLGCGKGRALVFAATHPMQRVIGVELSPDLCDAARQNLSSARLRCTRWEVVCGPAESYAIPDDVSVLYLFNPFRGATLRAVIDNLRQSLERAPRGLTLIYVLPRDQDNPFERESLLTKTLDRPSEGLRLVLHRSGDKAAPRN